MKYEEGKTYRTNDPLPIEDKQGEVWRGWPLDDHHPMYQVSNMGRVKQLKHGHFMMLKEVKMSKSKRPAVSVSDGQGFKGKKPLKELIADLWLPQCLSLPDVRVKDGNEDNMDIDNLEMCNLKREKDDKRRAKYYANK